MPMLNAKRFGSVMRNGRILNAKSWNQQWRTLKFIQPSQNWRFSAEEKDEKLHIKEVIKFIKCFCRGSER
jgi:hypothetical protein